MGHHLPMKLTYPPEAEAFRVEIRDWLERNLPAGWFDAGFELSGDDRAAFNKQWPRKLFEGGWICASWPQEYGGKGLGVMQAVVLNEEFARAGAPMRGDFFGDTLVGPTILQWGKEAQKKEFLPGILQGRTAWCQGFSEPGSGSDLAALGCKAELDGDEWVINGQKVWTTQAQHADYVFLLARTDPAASKHKGISYLLVPMRQPGVEVRPIVQVDRSAEFNEVFFTDARCPATNVVGGVNQIMRINGLRSLSTQLMGKKDPDMAAIGATNKMFWSEHHRSIMELAIDILGMHGQILTGSDEDQMVPGVGFRGATKNYPVTPLQASFFFSRSETIWGGTAEIQRNIVGERVLGLPKEPGSRD